jgi:RNA:NAD 2'-phosphotransferase (TPT1/KptA family)
MPKGINFFHFIQIFHPMTDRRVTTVSKEQKMNHNSNDMRYLHFISWVRRHDPGVAGISLDANGRAVTAELLAGINVYTHLFLLVQERGIDLYDKREHFHLLYHPMIDQLV